MWLLAALLALPFAGGGAILDLVSSKGKSPAWQYTSTVIAAILTFVVLSFVNLLVFWGGTPTFSGSGWVGMACLEFGVTLVIFGLANLFTGRLSAATVISVVMLLALPIGVLGIYNNWNPGNNRATMGHELTVLQPSKTAVYPNTSDSAIVTVSDDNALYEAGQAMNTDIPGTSTPLGTVYGLNQCVLKPVDAEMNYICSLKIEGTANIRQAKGILPGYIVVNAQNPNLPAVVKWGYPMTYYVGGTYGHSIDRLIWNSGWGKQYSIDDLSLEVNDKWQPIYTATLVRSIFRMQQGVPVGMITIDPTTGKITEYPIDNQPSYVTRTYSSGMATTLSNFWGEWGTVPWNVQGTSGRYMVDGNVNLVYTTTGPAWQVLLTSKNTNDPSISYIGLMSTTRPVMQLFKAPNGLLSQAKVTHAIVTSQNNLKSLVPASLALHLIDGELVWVAPLEAANADNPVSTTDATTLPLAATGEASLADHSAESSAGVALLSATDPNSSDVIVADNMSDALQQLDAQVANGNGTTVPGSTASYKSVTGVIAAATADTINKTANEVIRLVGDNNHLYVGTITGTSFQNYQMSLATPGDTVTMTYVDNDGPIRNISSYTLVSSGVSSSAKPVVSAVPGK